MPAPQKYARSLRRSKKKSLAKTASTSGTESPERRTSREARSRHEARTNAATRNDNADETRTSGKPTKTKARPPQRLKKPARHDAAELIHGGTSGAKTPQQASTTSTVGGAAVDAANKARPTEDKADHARPATKGSKQHEKHPRKEKVAA